MSEFLLLDEIGGSLCAEPVAKHGDPSRPGYAALHPHSHAAGAATRDESPATDIKDHHRVGASRLLADEEFDALANAEERPSDVWWSLHEANHITIRQIKEESGLYSPDRERGKLTEDQRRRLDEGKKFEEQADALSAAWGDRHFETNGKGVGSHDWYEAIDEPGQETRNWYVVKDAPLIKENARLRAGGRPGVRTKAVDAMVAQGVVTAPVLLHRGAVLPADLHAQMIPGFAYTDRGFQSTDHSASIARHYAQSRRDNHGMEGDIVLMRVHVKPGQQAVDVGYGEFVMPRGLTMTVTGRTVAQTGEIVLDMEVSDGGE